MVERVLRRGLPRIPGGEPWPPAGVVVEDAVAEAPAAAGTASQDAEVEAAAIDGAPAEAASVSPSVVERPSASSGTARPEGGRDRTQAPAQTRLRRGLPRTPGGEPWPPAGSALHVVAAGAPAGDRDASSPSPASSSLEDGPAEPAAVPTSVGAGWSPDREGSSPAVVARSRRARPEVGRDGMPGSAPAPLRRGLPRTPGAEPWPPADTVLRAAATAAPATGAGVSSAVSAEPALDERPAAAAPVAAPVIDRARPVVEGDAAQRSRQPPARSELPKEPLRWTQTVWPGTAPRHGAPAPASDRRRPTWTQAIAGLFAAAALGVLAAAAVAFVRALLSTPLGQDFLAAFPGEYHLPEGTAEGIPGWVGWQHFFNVFLMVLIIRSGIRVRTEKRPTVFWTSRRKAKHKISLTLWFHQALDLLWLINGIVFVVLLFVTGHWVRLVPTSWEVFPNALSAALQYISLDWPTENGWVNYNSLQQLAYFATVFLAAPLAAVTGFRMSGLWPKNAERLSRAYPVEWARAVHFPVMIYFVAFIVVHVALVMMTGFLRNLNHMYASQDAVTWTGFWVFAASLVVIAIGWIAARPLVLAPIAKVFGQVSGR